MESDRQNDSIDAEFRVVDDSGNPVTEFSKGPTDRLPTKSDKPKIYFETYEEELEDYHAQIQQYLAAAARGEDPLYKPEPPKRDRFRP